MYIRVFISYFKRSEILDSDWILFLLIYSETYSGPEDVGKTGTSFTSGRTSEPFDVRKTAERSTLWEP